MLGGFSEGDWVCADAGESERRVPQWPEESVESVSKSGCDERVMEGESKQEGRSDGGTQKRELWVSVRGVEARGAQEVACRHGDDCVSCRLK